MSRETYIVEYDSDEQMWEARFAKVEEHGDGELAAMPVGSVVGRAKYVDRAVADLEVQADDVAKRTRRTGGQHWKGRTS